MQEQIVRSREFTFSLDEIEGLTDHLNLPVLKKLVAAMAAFSAGGEYHLPYSVLNLTDLETLYVSVKNDDEHGCVVIKVHSQEMERNS